MPPPKDYLNRQFIDALREFLGLTPLYKELEDLPPERFIVDAENRDGVKRNGGHVARL